MELRNLVLAAIVLVGAFLRFAHLGDVPGNPFYDAAVHTMSLSWHSFFYGALDPSGGVSVDKPPVDLWAQVASVKLFGWSPTSLKLPQALAGTASIVLVYDLVRRPFGYLAGLAAAAALAVLPVAVLTARSDTMDTLMAFLLLLAAWFTVRAIERGRVGWLLAAGATVGLAFNVKLFQALLPVGALALLWAFGSPLRPKRTILYGLAAVGVAVVVGLSWIVPVALTPASQRPYPIGSTNGSIWNLVFVFNGIDRLHGRPVTTPDTLPPGSHVSAAVLRNQLARSRHLAVNPSASQLIGPRYGPRIGSEVVPALLILLLAALALRRRAGPVGLGLAAWVLTGVLVFSMMGRFHPRYFEAISPAVAAVVGAGLVALASRGGRAGRILAAVAVGLTGIYASRLDSSAATVELIACGVAAIALALTAVRPVAIGAVTVLAVAAVLVVPTSQSWAVARTNASDSERSGAMPTGWPEKLNAYLVRHRSGAKYIFASVAPAKAAPLIETNPQPVLMLTSYRSRPLLSVPRFERIVRAGRVRYVLIGHRCSSALTRHTAACPATARWAIAHSTDVTRATGIGRHHGLLYAISYCPAGPAQAHARGRTARPSARRRSARSASRSIRARCVPRPTASDA